MKQVKESLYPIREISRMTGVTPITLRAWERRYGLIEPIRTDSGHRLYTQMHIDYIKKAVELTKTGVPISKVKGLIEASNDEMADELLKFEQSHAQTIQEALDELNHHKVSKAIDMAFMDLPDELLRSLLTRLVLENQNSNHYAMVLLTSLVRPKLYTRLRYRLEGVKDKHGQKVLLTTNSADSEILAILAADWLAVQGYDSLIVPQEELNDDKLLDTLTNLKCSAVAIVNSETEYQAVEWIDWMEQHKGYEMFFFIQKELDSAVASALQTRQIDLKNWH